MERLRNAGAIILGKTSLSKWYKIRSIDHLPNGWCARSGQGVVSFFSFIFLFIKIEFGILIVFNV